MSTIGWSQERTDEVLVPVIKDMNRREAEGTQSNITKYFQGSVGVGAKEAFAPRQRVQTSKRMVNAVNRLRANVAGGNVDDDPSVEANSAPTEVGRRKRKARNPAIVEENDVVNGPPDEQAEDGVEEPAKKKGKEVTKKKLRRVARSS
jgi:DNA excision repair protein ERCC-5